MSYCLCGRERWEYLTCLREGCWKREGQMVKYRVGLSKEEPAPKKNENPGVWTMVMIDMAQRDMEGAKKYGTRLQPHNGRDALVDAYQEALDLCVYLRQAIYERDGK